jgi:hypothetical protein
MKNNRGQVLVLFIMILPVIFIGVACIIDSSYMMYQKNRLDNINIDVLNSVKDKIDLTEKDVLDLIYLNDAKIVNIDISIDDTITIDNYILIDSIFGKIIGFDEYKVSSSVSVNYIN